MGGWWVNESLWAGHTQLSSVLEVIPGYVSLFVFVGALHGEGDGWVVRQLQSLLDLCAQGSPQQVVKVGLVWDASFCASFLPSVVWCSFGSGDPASPRIYPSYYLVDIARAGEICHGGLHLKRMSYDY
jgi:hypothetical protein